MADTIEQTNEATDAVATVSAAATEAKKERAVLTDPAVKAFACPANASMASLRDANIKGLELRATAGKKVWRLHYVRKSDKQRSVVHIGDYPAVTLKDARFKASALKADIANGGDPASGIRAKKEAPTFAEVADMWLEQHAKPKKREKSVAEDISILKNHILPAIGDMKVHAVGKGQVNAMVDGVSRAKDARFTKNPAKAPKKPMARRPNSAFTLTHTILEWAEARDYVAANPMRAMSPPTKQSMLKVRDRVLTEAEIRKVWAALDAAPVLKRTARRAAGDVSMTRVVALSLMLSLATGQRIGECSGAAKSEFDLNDVAPVWVIPGDRAKNKREHRVPLTPLALWIIREALKLSGDGSYLFSSRGRMADVIEDGHEVRRMLKADAPVNRMAVTAAWAASRKTLGLADVNSHDFRRTVLNGMSLCGVLPLTISMVGNHASARSGVTMKHYTPRDFDPEKLAALTTWAAHLTAIIDNAPSNVTQLRPALASA